MVNHLRDAFPDQTRNMADTELRQRLVVQRKAAQKWGIVVERAVALYIDLLWGAGPDADRIPWIQEILLESRLDGLARMKEIYRQLPRRLVSPVG